MTSLWSSFVRLFSSHENPSVRSKSVPGNGTEAESLVLEILEIYASLKALKDFKPCSEVNELFERLVDLCIANRSSEITNLVLQDPRLLAISSELRRICEEAECSLESHWAELIIGRENSSPEEVYSRLTQFPYFQNYIDLTRLELYTINGIRNSRALIQKIAFLGSGPLPLSSLCLCLCQSSEDLSLLPNTGTSPISVLNIDNNPSAISRSKILSERLGLQGGQGMEFLLSDAGDEGADLRGFEVVYLAALVGGSQEEKEGVLSSVVGRMSVGSLVVVRSAERLRRVLYPAFDPCSEVVRSVLDVLVVVHPFDHVVNSVIVGRVKGRGLEDGVGDMNK